MKINLKTGTLELKNLSNQEKFLENNCFRSRNNNKRGFLFLSKVLGKYYPVSPSKIEEVNKELAEKFLSKLEMKESYFIGFAETATLISENVYDIVMKEIKEENKNLFVYQHSTRYLTSEEVEFEFLEEHCHAPQHIFYKIKDKNKIEVKDMKQLVLIDDEISTGTTCLNILKQMFDKYKKVEKVFIVSLLSFVSEENHLKIKNFAKENNVEIEMINLINGEYSFDYDSSFLKDFTPSKSICDFNDEEIKKIHDRILDNKTNSRYGTSNNTMELNKYFSEEEIKSYANNKTLVLGTGEFMYKPFLLAKELEKLNSDIKYQTTARSPLNVDCDVKSLIKFKDNYWEDIDNFLYNVIDKDYDNIIICYETLDLPNDHKLELALKEKMPNTKIKTLFL